MSAAQFSDIVTISIPTWVAIGILGFSEIYMLRQLRRDDEQKHKLAAQDGDNRTEVLKHYQEGQSREILRMIAEVNRQLTEMIMKMQAKADTTKEDVCAMRKEIGKLQEDLAALLLARDAQAERDSHARERRTESHNSRKRGRAPVG
jgi:hypothetical protein